MVKQCAAVIPALECRVETGWGKFFSKSPKVFAKTVELCSVTYDLLLVSSSPDVDAVGCRANLALGSGGMLVLH
jgi:hypothetical protein